MAALACHLPVPEQRDGGEGGDPWLGLALGAARGTLSREWLAQADRVLHQGVGAYHERAFTDVFSRLSDALSPRTHLHLHGEEAAEIMPWLWLAVRSDPKNVNAYVAAAFWMAGEVDRPDLAREILEEARRLNPDDYRIRLEQGRFFLKFNDPARAWIAFSAARRLWAKHSEVEELDQAKIDGAEIFFYHGLLKETRDDPAGAMADYRQVLEWFPGRSGLQARLQRLAAGEKPETSPFALWRESIAGRRHVCEFEKNAAGDHDHGDASDHTPKHDHDHEQIPVRGAFETQ